MVVCVYKTSPVKGLVRVAVVAVHLLSCALVAWIATDVATVMRHVWKFTELPMPMFVESSLLCVISASATGLGVAAAGLLARMRFSKLDMAILGRSLSIFGLTLALGLTALMVNSICGAGK